MKNYKLKITVTKEILKRSMMCGTTFNENDIIGTGCAIALAVIDIFPKAAVVSDRILPTWQLDKHYCKGIPMPQEVTEFISLFDNLSDTPEKRLDLPEITFEVEIPDEVIDKIDISKIYEGHPTLQLFESIDN